MALVYNTDIKGRCEGFAADVLGRLKPLWSSELRDEAHIVHFDWIYKNRLACTTQVTRKSVENHEEWVITGIVRELEKVERGCPHCTGHHPVILGPFDDHRCPVCTPHDWNNYEAQRESDEGAAYKAWMNTLLVDFVNRNDAGEQA